MGSKRLLFRKTRNLSKDIMVQLKMDEKPAMVDRKVIREHMLELKKDFR